MALSVYATAGVSGAHLNPAISFALAIVRPGEFSWRELMPYTVAQVCGATLGSAAVYGAWHEPLARKELQLNLTRGAPDSIHTAMAFGEYFPNPTAGLGDAVSFNAALGLEAFGTGPRLDFRVPLGRFASVQEIRVFLGHFTCVSILF